MPDPNEPPLAPPVPGMPRPPANALPIPARGAIAPIYYNQPVVLQCVSTAVVSPILIIRQIDKASTVLGGGRADSSTMPAISGRGSRESTPSWLTTADGRVPVAPGELLGDQVTQLNKVAFELLGNPESAYGAQHDPTAGWIGSGTFLACLGEVVGVHHTESARSVPTTSTPGTPALTPSSASSSLSSGPPTWSGSPYEESEQRRGSMLNAPTLDSRSRSNSLNNGALEMTTNDGGRVRKQKRTAQSDPMGRRRGASVSVMQGHGLPASHLPMPSMRVEWSLDCGESSVWTISTVDISRHTFYVPEDTMNNPLQRTYASVPSSPITLSPFITSYEQAPPDPQTGPMLRS